MLMEQLTFPYKIERKNTFFNHNELIPTKFHKCHFVIRLDTVTKIRKYRWTDRLEV